MTAVCVICLSESGTLRRRRLSSAGPLELLWPLIGGSQVAPYSAGARKEPRQLTSIPSGTVTPPAQVPTSPVKLLFGTWLKDDGIFRLHLDCLLSALCRAALLVSTLHGRHPLSYNRSQESTRHAHAVFKYKFSSSVGQVHSRPQEAW